MQSSHPRGHVRRRNHMLPMLDTHLRDLRMTSGREQATVQPSASTVDRAIERQEGRGREERGGKDVPDDDVRLLDEPRHRLSIAHVQKTRVRKR